ncbi:hypothetical protein [Paenibacillus sp. FSL K6-2524]|uniref:hypothetical protein n=1 Tax=Paenibacillus sp. FSL K6-2524 TaxID=2954516 RepID=UPI0030F52DD7
MHSLEIKDRSIYLDGVPLKGVIDYKLEDSVNHGAQLLVTLLVDTVKVLPPMIGATKEADGPEVISPLSKLEEMTGCQTRYYGITADKTNGGLAEQIRQIVREEIAAHEERLNKTWKPLIPSSYQPDTQD